MTIHMGAKCGHSLQPDALSDANNKVAEAMLPTPRVLPVFRLACLTPSRNSLLAGSDQPWLCWRSLNRLRTGIGRAKTTMRKWGYIDNTQSVNCGLW